MSGAATTLPASPARAGGAAVRWLRVSAIVALLFALGHTLGGLKGWAPIASPALEAMRSASFAAEGVTRTYDDFYRGFGFSLSVFMLLEAIVLWQLAGLATQAAVRPIVGAFAAASLATTAIAWAFIMPVPAVFSTALTVCLGAAFYAC